MTDMLPRIRAFTRPKRHSLMAQPFKTKSGVYYIRRKVPAELVPLLHSEYKRSLETKDAAEARRRFPAFLAQSELAFEAARKQLKGEQAFTNEQLHGIAHEWYERELERLERSADVTEWLHPLWTSEAETPHGPIESTKWGTFKDQEAQDEAPDYEAILSPQIEKILAAKGCPRLPKENASWGVLVRLMTNALHTLSGRALAYHDGLLTRLPGALVDAPKAAPAKSKRPEAHKTIWDAFEAYATAKRLSGVARSNEGTIKSYRGMIQTFVELFGVLDLDKITREIIHKHRGYLAQMPSVGQGVRKLPAPVQIERAKTDQLPVLSQETIRNHLRALSSILTQAKRLGWVSDNIVEQSGVMDLISQAIRNSAKVKDTDFTQDELRSVFSSPVFAGCKDNALHRKFGDAASWLPLLLYYTGARREEVAQLKVNEVKQIQGIHCLDIMTSGDDGERGVKTASSRRVIPLHQDLISRGFLSYVQTLPADGQLFPKLKPCPDGYYATAFGRAWGAYLRSVLKLDITAAPLHGFRHTFKTLCRGSGITEDVMDAIAGHAANTVARGYGVMPLTRMAEELKKFPSIPS